MVAQPGGEGGDEFGAGSGVDHVLPRLALDHRRRRQQEGGGQAGDLETRCGGETGLAAAGRAREVPGRAERHQMPAVDDGHAIAESLRLVHGVGGEDHRRPPLLEPDDDLPGGEAGVGVHPGGRFVEEDDLGLPHQRQGQREPLPLAAGQAPDQRAGRRPESDEVEQRLRILVVGVVGGEEPQRLERPDPRIEAALLEHHPDPGREGGVVADRVEAEHPGGAGVGGPVPLQRLDGRGLPGAVGAEQPEDLAALDGERQPVHRQIGAVGLLQPLDLDRRTLRLRHRHRRVSRTRSAVRR